MKQLEKPIGNPLKECKCLNEFITNFLKRFLNDQRLNRDNFINKQVVTINGEKHNLKQIDHEAENEAITILWHEYKHELYEGILNIRHLPECELVLDVERRLKDDQYAISNKISNMEKEYFIEGISERRRDIFSLLNGPVFDVMKVKALYKTIYYYTRLIELFSGDSKNDTTDSNGQNIQIKEFTEKSNPELSLAEIALLHCYLPIKITKENANDIAGNYGYKSGLALFQNHWTTIMNRTNRINVDTPKKSKNRLKRMEKIKPFITDSKGLNTLNDEYNTLEINIKKNTDNY